CLLTSAGLGSPREAGAVSELAAAATEQAPQPVEQGTEPVGEAGQERDVDEGPGQPAGDAAEAKPMQADHRTEPSHRRHAPEVAVLERGHVVAARDATADGLGGVDPLLH